MCRENVQISRIPQTQGQMHKTKHMCGFKNLMKRMCTLCIFLSFFIYIFLAVNLHQSFIHLGPVVVRFQCSVNLLFRVIAVSLMKWSPRVSRDIIMMSYTNLVFELYCWVIKLLLCFGLCYSVVVLNGELMWDTLYMRFLICCGTLSLSLKCLCGIPSSSITHPDQLNHSLWCWKQLEKAACFSLCCTWDSIYCCWW